MPESVKVKSIMNTRLITLHPKDKINRASEIFENYDLHHIPITIMNKVVGIVSEGDLFFAKTKVHKVILDFKRTFETTATTIDQIMTINPICVAAETTLKEAIQLMITKRINALPVVEEEELIGIITSFDILNFVLENNLTWIPSN